MQKKFLLNLILLVFLNLLIKSFYILGIDTEVLNRVGAESYGNYFALINFSFLLNILLDLGITNFNTKNIAQHNQLLGKYLPSMLSLRMVLSVFYVSVCLVLGWLWGYSISQLSLLLLLAFNQSIAGFILYFRSNLTGLQLFRQDSFISVLDRALLIIFSAVLLWGNLTQEKLKIEWFVYAQTLAYSISALVAFLIVYSKSGMAPKIKLNWSMPFSLLILKQSFPYALLVILMMFSYRSDSVMLEKMLDDGALQAGIYAQGFRFFEAAYMIPNMFGVLLLPMFSKMIKDKDSIVELLELSVKILLSFGAVLTAVCWFYSYDIMNLRYDANIETSATAFSLLMLCFFAISLSYVFGTLLTANGNLKYLNILSASAMFLNIGLNYWLIPDMAAEGSAVASLITQSIFALIQIFIVIKMFRLTFNIKLIAAALLFLGGLICFGYFSKSFFENVWFNIASLSLFGLLWAMLTRMLSFKAMYQIIKYNK